MRQAFADESGTNPKDPYFVVAGPVVHADEELIPAEDHIRSLAAKYAPEIDPRDFIFHAVDIWNNNNFKDKERWPRDLCWDMLWDLASTPYLLDLPIAMGFQRRETVLEIFRDHIEKLEEKHRPLARDTLNHVLSFLSYSHGVERTMQELWPNEVAEFIVENRQEVQKMIADMHDTLKRAEKITGGIQQGWTAFPLTRVRGGIKFAAKRDEPMLQIADVCAYVTRSVLGGSMAHAPFYNIIYPVMLCFPKDQVWPPPTWPTDQSPPGQTDDRAERESELARLKNLFRAARDARKSTVE